MPITLSAATQNAAMVHTDLSLGQSPASSSRPHLCFMAHLLLLHLRGVVAPCPTCPGPRARLAAASPLRSAFAPGIPRSGRLAGSFAAPRLRPGQFAGLRRAWLLSAEHRAPPRRSPA